VTPIFSYLGAKLREMQLLNGVYAWSLLASKYVQEAVRNVEDYFQRERSGHIWPKHAPTPFPCEYKPKLDVTELLNDNEASFFQSLIRVLWWMVEIGRINIITEVSMLASCVAAPQRGQLDTVFHMFAYLEKKHYSRLIFDPTYPKINMDEFKECNWKEYYGDVKEAVPPNAPFP
jgi:hypothetical protein